MSPDVKSISKTADMTSIKNPTKLFLKNLPANGDSCSFAPLEKTERKNESEFENAETDITRKHGTLINTLNRKADMPRSAPSHWKTRTIIEIEKHRKNPLTAQSAGTKKTPSTENAKKNESAGYLNELNRQ